MKTGKDKISVKQLLFIFTIIISSPATRIIPKDAAAKAAQAGWVSPIICVVPFIALILIIDSIMKKYEGQSMSEIIASIMGNFLGRLMLVIYLLWALMLLALYMRYYVERLTSSIYPNVDNKEMLFLTLIPIAYMLRSGLTVIARMSEILLPFIGLMLVMLAAFLFPKVRVDTILPVYFNDIVPMWKASFSSTAILAYLFLLFFLSDKLVNLKSFKKFGYIAAYVNISSLMLVNFITIGVLGSSVVERSPMPVLSVVKQVSILETIENIEAIIIAIWIFADFTLISTFFFVILNMVKSLFKLSDTKPIINILVILLYFLSLGICSDKFELEAFFEKVAVPLNIILGYGFPIILFILSKLKKGTESSAKES